VYEVLVKSLDTQIESEKLCDVLFVLLCAIKRSRGGEGTLFYDVIVSDGRKQEKVKLKAVCGPGDDGEPVLTVMLEGED